MRRVVLMVAAVSVFGASSASAQPDRPSNRDIIERLERIERRLAELSPAPRRAASSPTNLQCTTNCATLAATYCRQAGYNRGIPVEITPGAGFTLVTRVNCND